MRLNDSSRAVSLLLFLPLSVISMGQALNAQKTPANMVPLKNWATPRYWHANQAEEQAIAGSLPQEFRPQLQLSVNALSTNALTFVAITPCRLVDTRGLAAGFNGITPFSGPSIPAGGTLTIPVQSPSEAVANTEPAPCGVIPYFAQAYSLNLTVVPGAGGSVGYVSLWPAGSPQPVVATVTDPQGLIVSHAPVVAAGAPVGLGGVSVYNSGPAFADVIIDMNGYFTAPSDGGLNTAIGAGALASNIAGTDNTASGYGALRANTSGSDNTAHG